MRFPEVTDDGKAFQDSLSADPETRRHQLAEANKSKTVLDLDPPEHGRLRGLITRAFSVRSVEASEPMIAGYVEQLIDGLSGETAGSRARTSC